MEFEKIDVLEFLPQQPPFVMVDKLLYSDATTTKTTLTVRDENIFTRDGFFSEAGLIENIAQTCATRAVNNRDAKENSGVKIGFIGMIRNLEIHRLPKINETIVTQINLIDEVFQIALVNATVYIDDELIASGEMKISITDKVVL